MATKTEVRSRARKLLDLFGEDGKFWTTGALHKIKSDGDGNEIDTYCLLGGMNKLKMPSSWLEDALRKTGRGDGIIDFNDTHRWPTIRNFLSKLIHRPMAVSGK